LHARRSASVGLTHVLNLPDDFQCRATTLDGEIATGVRQILASTPPFARPFGQSLNDADAFDLGNTMTKMFEDLVGQPGWRLTSRCPGIHAPAPPF
jgi:hypothetical protein